MDITGENYVVVNETFVKDFKYPSSVGVIGQRITIDGNTVEVIGVVKDFKKDDRDLCSYDLAHHAGLSVEEEYEFFCLLYELQRLEYLKRHLSKILPVVSGIESLKERIQLNGHFRELKGFNFNV